MKIRADMDRCSPDQPRYFAIKGWHKDASAQVAICTAADIITARRIIASQVAALAERCEQLDRNLQQSANFDVEVEKSKTRPLFELTISKGGKHPTRAWRHQPQNDTRPRERETAPNNQNVAGWLATNASEGAAYLACGLASYNGLSAQIKKSGIGIIKVTPGEGTPQRVASGNPNRSRPQTGSLAQWFAETPSTARSAISGYLLGAGATALDYKLIRHRLLPGQYVCTERGSKVAESFACDWDGRIIEWPLHIVFLEPGPRYLDPPFIPRDRLGEIDWPRISVVTVSYNQAAYLEDCLRSVLDQDYPNLEYIVVDAVSSDGSQEILRHYEPQLSRLIIEPDEGQSHGLNKGLDLATGDILTWINSDDMLAPGALRRAALAFLDDKCDLVTGGCERITKNSTEVSSLHHPALPYGRTIPMGFFEHFMWTNSWEHGDYFYQPEVLFTAEIWRRSGAYLKQHLHWAMDWDLWIRMGLAGATISHIPETLGRSREHGAQKTTSEQRYLYQLKNILLEHDDALSRLEQTAENLSEGEIPDWINFDAGLISPCLQPSLYKRIWRLRDPKRLRDAIRHRLPEPIKKQIGRFWNLCQPAGMRNAISRRLSARFKDRLRTTRRSLLYSLGGVSLISRVRLKELTRSQELLVEAERDAREARSIRAELELRLTQLHLRCTELSEQCLQLSDWRTATETGADTPAHVEAYHNHLSKMHEHFQRTTLQTKVAYCHTPQTEGFTRKQKTSAVETISKSIADFATNLLFGRTSDAQSRQTIATLLSHGSSMEDALRTIAIQCYPEQSKPTFTANRGLLACPVAMPQISDADHHLNEFTIIDIGAEALFFESDVYSALLQHRPSLVICFDPTDKAAPRLETTRDDDIPRCEIRTLPHFIGDGQPSTFNRARMQPTSSLLDPNLALARRFSLLAEALEVVESRAVETRRLDDIVAEQNISDRPIDFLKIDVQGATLPVLNGARETLLKTLVCQLEAEFSEIYLGEALFSDIDRHMRDLGFILMDITTLGRQRYNAFDVTNDRFFHAGRLLWADCVYVRHLDNPEKLTDTELLKLAEIAHIVYGKYDVAAFVLQIVSNRVNSTVYEDYIAIWN